MHELGVVFYVIRDVKAVAEENKVTKVNAVTLRVGEVSGILHDYLTDCWNWAKKKESIMEDAELRIETIKAITHCEDCGEDYETVRYAKICPKCGSEHTYLLTGNEFLIKEIEVAETEETDNDENDGNSENYKNSEYYEELGDLEEVEAEEEWTPEDEDYEEFGDLEEVEAEEEWTPDE